MITKFIFEKWKSFEKSELNIDPLTIIIGTNSSGKSNALDAISFLTRISNGLMLTSALQGDGIIPPLRGGVEWAAQKPGEIFSIGLSVIVDESIEYSYTIECSAKQNRCELISERLERIKYRIGRKKMESGRIRLFWTDQVSEGSPTIVARLYNEKRGTPRQLSRSNSILFQLVGQKSRVEIQEGVDQVINALRNIFILDPIPSHMRGFARLSDRLDPDAGNIAGVIAALPESARVQIEAVLTEYVRQLPEKDIRRVYAETVGKFATDAMLYCEEQWGEKEGIPIVDARGMSDGTLRFLAILTALQTRPPGSLLIIEEVDNGLHPSRSHLLLKMLREVGSKRKVDVVVTTHNPALLDAMGTEMVPFITVAHRNPKTGASMFTLLEDIKVLPKLLALGPVGRLTSQGLIENSLKSEAAN
ncbi:AAA family ATPase [Neoroseomonas oryzicola]|uniref:AAA family ATPase n=1 Tax=Neoroseomonas oryzicola TaxID=535904 RepID=A0A9X9WMJ4_9PROT|nr:ATP-binding protein [Neoroseomonas oryzicola]MBR0661554.1 AAA family ATPase [Neoroseomonas oryzicola]NKE18388.1 AAA family ATPase [Neoroseomonas oryzicola]